MKMFRQMICLLLMLALLPAAAFAQETEDVGAPELLQITAIDDEKEDAKEEPAGEEVEAADETPIEEREYAVVYAPRTGKASMRERASTSSDIIRQFKDGAVIKVEEYGEKFTRISYKNKEGYMLTSALDFEAAVEAPIGEGVLTYNGTSTGATTINVRSQADKNSRKIGEWKTGTEVTVFGSEDGWVKIEVDEIRGWVMEEYLTMIEEIE